MLMMMMMMMLIIRIMTRAAFEGWDFVLDEIRMQHRRPSDICSISNKTTLNICKLPTTY